MSITNLIISLIKENDWLAILLITIFIFSFILCLIKFFFLYKIRLGVDDFLIGIFNNLKKNNIFECVNLCDDLKDVPVADLTKVAIFKSPEGLEQLKSAVENEGILQRNKIEKGLIFIQTSIFVCPFLGLLGSLSGITRFFLTLDTSKGNTNITDLSSYIGQALIYVLLALAFTTILYTFYNFLITQLKNALNDMSITTNRLYSFFSSEKIDTKKIAQFIKPYDI